MDDIFIPGVIPANKKIAKDRFNLVDGQVYTSYIYRNLWWSLNGVNIGQGDLREADFERIKKTLRDGEIFLGWNEHQGSSQQQTPRPMVRITNDYIGYPQRDEDNYPTPDDFEEAQETTEVT